jgi:hypothetical protein
VAVEADERGLDHGCTSVHLAPVGQVCLGYTKEGGRLSATQGLRGGNKSLRFEAGIALRFHSTHPATLAAIGGNKFYAFRTTRKPSLAILVAVNRRETPAGWQSSEEDPAGGKYLPPGESSMCTFRAISEAPRKPSEAILSPLAGKRKPGGCAGSEGLEVEPRRE